MPKVAPVKKPSRTKAKVATPKKPGKGVTKPQTSGKPDKPSVPVKVELSKVNVKRMPDRVTIKQLPPRTVVVQELPAPKPNNFIVTPPKPRIEKTRTIAPASATKTKESKPQTGKNSPKKAARIELKPPQKDKVLAVKPPKPTRVNKAKRTDVSITPPLTGEMQSSRQHILEKDQPVPDSEVDHVFTVATLPIVEKEYPDDPEELLALARKELGLDEYEFEIPETQDVSKLAESTVNIDEDTRQTMVALNEFIGAAQPEERADIALTLVAIHEVVQECLVDELSDFRAVEIKIEQLLDSLQIAHTEEIVGQITASLIEHQAAFSQAISSPESFDKGTREILDSASNFFQYLAGLLEPIHTLLGRAVLSASAH